MSDTTIAQIRSTADASQLVPRPTWSDRSDYQRTTDRNGDRFLVTDTATIVTDPFAAVAIEWQTDVHSDGTVGPTLEAVKLTTGDDEAYIDSKQLAHVMFLICYAAAQAGVTL